MSANAFADLPAQLPGVAMPAAQSAATASSPPIGGPYDPSAQGGTLQIGSWDTGVHTPAWLDRTLAGAGRGLVHTFRSLANLGGLVPNEVMSEERAIDAPLLATTAGKVGNTLGEAAATAPLGGLTGNLVGKLAPWAAKSLLAQGAAQGAVQGVATADPNERAKQALGGALTGGVLGAAARGAQRLVSGLPRTPAAQYLLDQGVSLTPGRMYPPGAMNQFEQSAESVPGFKQLIDPALENAEQQYRALIIQKGAAPGAKITPSENISDMLQQAYDSYAPLYEQAKGFPIATDPGGSPLIMRTEGADIPLSQAFEQAANASGVPKSLQRSENEWLQDRLTQLAPNPQSEDLLALRSAIRQRARDANLRTDLNAGHVANIQDRADQAVTAALQSQLPPDALEALNTADSNYGNYKIIENAVARSKDNLAGLTPQKLSQAIYDAVPDAAYARGAGGPLRDLARAGTEVFQTVSPPTGARLAALGLGGWGAMAHPYVAIPAAVGALGLTATQTGRRLAGGLTAPQQYAQRLASALISSVPPRARNVVAQLAARSATGALMPVGERALPAALAAALMYAPAASQESAQH